MLKHRPLSANDLLQIREQWGQDRVVNTLLWEIARLRNSVRVLNNRLNAVHSYLPPDVIVPDDGEVDRLLEREPAINDEIERRHSNAAIIDGVSERELKRVARQLRG